MQINKENLKLISQHTKIEVSKLKSYFCDNKIPVGNDLYTLAKYFNMDITIFKLKYFNVVHQDMINFLCKNYSFKNTIKENKIQKFQPDFISRNGRLYQKDCVNFLKSIEDERYDLIFADPPFNVNKMYPSEIDDNLKENDYLNWMISWINELVRTLKTGGALFIWNLPKWNIRVVEHLCQYLYFKDWIAVDMKQSLPIKGRLYPSHYSLIYFTKSSKPNFFSPDRIPMQICPKCYGDLKDYGGHKSKMNSLGVNITNVWNDIPTVRHNKYKRRKSANELSIKLLDRIIEMASKPGDLIFDPFGGSGVTYIVAELKNRRWEGTEIGPLNEIIARFNILDVEKEILENYRRNINCLFTDKTKTERIKRKLWVK